jgi:hypothetical protein
VHFNHCPNLRDRPRHDPSPYLRRLGHRPRRRWISREQIIGDGRTQDGREVGEDHSDRDRREIGVQLEHPTLDTERPDLPQLDVFPSRKHVVPQPDIKLLPGRRVEGLSGEPLLRERPERSSATLGVDVLTADHVRNDLGNEPFRIDAPVKALAAASTLAVGIGREPTPALAVTLTRFAGAVRPLANHRSCTCAIPAA